MYTRFYPFPVLNTERLLLRQVTIHDDHEIFLQRSNPQLQEFVEVVQPKSIEYAQYFIRKINESVAEGSCVYWGMALKDSPKIIGTICLWNISVDDCSAELGYALHPDFQRQGYMQEAVQTVESYGFNEMKSRLIFACPHVRNFPSIRLLEKNRYIRDGVSGDHARFIKSAEQYFS